MIFFHRHTEGTCDDYANGFAIAVPSEYCPGEGHYQHDGPIPSSMTTDVIPGLAGPFATADEAAAADVHTDPKNRSRFIAAPIDAARPLSRFCVFAADPEGGPLYLVEEVGTEHAARARAAELSLATDTQDHSQKVRHYLKRMNQAKTRAVRREHWFAALAHAEKTPDYLVLFVHPEKGYTAKTRLVEFVRFGKRGALWGRAHYQAGHVGALRSWGTGPWR